MRIGIFTDSYTPYISGLVTSEVMLKEALEKLGHTVYVVTANLENYKYTYDEKEKVIRIPGVPVGIYDARLTGIYPLQAIQTIKSWNLDVIHSQTEFGVGTFARIIAKQFNIPIVHTYHTMYEDYIHYITKGHFMEPSKKIVQYLTKFYCDKTITELIVPTQKTYDLFKEKYQIKRNVHIIPTGIEIEKFYKENFKKEEIIRLRRSLKISTKDFILTFVGRLGKEKSVDFLIEAHKKITSKYKNVKLLIIGDGPEMDDFLSLTKKLNLEDHIIFTGKVPWAMIPLYYQLSNVFVTASNTETQGLTLIEAMAASVPIVCLEDDSFKIAVVDDLNGYFFKSQDEYVNRISYLIDNPKEFKRLSNQARVSSEMHSSKYFALKVLGVYEIAIQNKVKNSKLHKLKNAVKKVFNGK
ncbi:MAG: glycosyltransferase family 4 protein [Firmicutes bacterium]|nr:glycosyltransferase family 4 protein [Bacillota bacterium]